MPMIWLAPGRLSTMNRSPPISVKPAAIARGRRSPRPPGGYGEMMRTGFTGQAWPCAACVQAIANTASNTVPARELIADERRGRGSVKLAVAAAARQLVTASHDELKAIAFAALVAADVYAARVADDLEITAAAHAAPRPVGVEGVRILGGNALHAPYGARMVPTA